MKAYHGCVQGRIGILEVHARDKELEDDIDFQKVARATAGSTGAELMNLMNQAAIVTVRQGRKKITQADIFEVCSSASPQLTSPHPTSPTPPHLTAPLIYLPELTFAGSRQLQCRAFASHT